MRGGQNAGVGVGLSKSWFERGRVSGKARHISSADEGGPAWGGDPEKPRFFGEGRREPPLEE
jgi:hypothetical protein